MAFLTQHCDDLKKLTWSFIEGVQPAKLLAITFTRVVTMEIRESVAVALGKAVSKELMITTFHLFSFQLCSFHADN